MAIANVEKIKTKIDPKLNLEKVKLECEEEVKKQAKVSAAAAVVPIPMMDLVVDAGLLTKLLPEISSRFGLTEDDQVINLDNKNKDSIADFKDKAVDFAGLVLTRSIAKKTFQGFGGRIVAKQVTKFIPFGGQIVAGTIGYLMFKKIANDHIEQCYQTAKKLQREQASQAL
ncbi:MULTISPECIES: hypothetical protein [unclassified Moraxella]|uniref:hypothetical protein n=1 Tax=unclassified Moraxella TaxID=2685852 RepID=UPI003AF660EA